MSTASKRRGLLARALFEAIEGVAGLRAEAVLELSLERAGLESVPEGFEEFRRFTRVALRNTVEVELGPLEADAIFERIGHLLWMASSDVQSREESAARERDEESGERPISVLPARLIPEEPPRPVGPARATVPARPRTPSTQDEPAPAMQPATLPAPARPSLSLARVTQPIARGVVELGPSDPSPVKSEPRLAAPPVPMVVLVLTLDPTLSDEAAQTLGRRAKVETIGSTTHLARALSSAAGRVLIVVDTTLPSIELRTFSALAPALPAHATVVLWGMEERNKQRLAQKFHVANSWVASGTAATLADVLVALR